MNRPKLKFVVLFAVTCALAVTWSVRPTSVTSAAGLQANYVAFGDSIAFGLYAPLGRGYVPLYATALHNLTGLQVNLLPLGVPGWTSADLANALKTNALFQLAAYSNNVITFNIGGNDLSRARSSFKAGTCGGVDNQQCLRDAVTTLKQTGGTLSAPSCSCDMDVRPQSERWISTIHSLTKTAPLGISNF